jgi:hypothetical protein
VGESQHEYFFHVAPGFVDNGSRSMRQDLVASRLEKMTNARAG